MKRYRVMLIDFEYYPQYRFLWFWRNYNMIHQGGGSCAMSFKTLHEAQEIIYRDIAQVQAAMNRPVKAEQVWTHD